MTSQFTATNTTAANPVPWHALGSDAVFAGLSSGPGGLSAAEAARRLAEFLEKAVHQRAKMARNLAQADEFIQRLGG
ncbi:hypothetical protein [Pseudarthrobacter sp. H2]|uniref:hypothetical protein n=1 Tax=Pseudarthrobacter sp. H2 TaxID=3418415 RepID=UPI003CEDD651